MKVKKNGNPFLEVLLTVFRPHILSLQISNIKFRVLLDVTGIYLKHKIF